MNRKKAAQAGVKLARAPNTRSKVYRVKRNIQRKKADKKTRKLPKNPTVGKTYNISVNSKSGKRKIRRLVNY